MDELRDAQLVTQRIIERQERAWNVRFETLTERFQTLTSVVEKHEDGIAEMRAAITSVLNSIDRFIRGQGRNGH